MRIAINTRFLLPHKMEGFGWFTYEVAKRIVIEHPEHDFYFFFDRKFDRKFIFSNNVIPLILSPPARHPILFKIWFNYSVTKALKKHKIDLFLSPDGYLSLKTNVKQIGVIHDLNFEHYPNDLPMSARQYLKSYFPRFAKKADHIVTVSNFSKHDIIKTYQIAENKITVAHNGGSKMYLPIKNFEKEAVKKSYSNGQDYFIYVGALHARKNIQRLFKAFDEFKTQTKSVTKLIVVGENLWQKKDESKSNTLSHETDIIFTGHLKIEELVKVMAAAKALTLVSYFEGFGIPLVEAMRCGTPIITSNITALPEVAGKSALLVDPFNVSEIAMAMQKIDGDVDLCNTLSKKGLERSKEFSWDKSASIIWEVIEANL